MNVMLIDDDRENLECLCSALRLNDYKVEAYELPAKAIEEYRPETVDVVISDYHFPATTGIAVLKAIHKKNAAAVIIIISGDPERKLKPLSMEAGAYAFYRKPLNIKKLMTKMNTLAGDKAGE